MYVENLKQLQQSVGYGTVGTHGTLGYEGLHVKVRQNRYEHTLSAHAPSRLVFELDGRFDEFSAQVAINDDVASQNTSADFVVYADDQVVAVVPSVRAGDAPRPVQAIIRGSQRLILVVYTTQWQFCHSVWLDPEVQTYPPEITSLEWRDALSRVKVQKPLSTPQMEFCIATVASQGYAHLLDDLLGSLHALDIFDDTAVVVFNVDSDPECTRVIEKYRVENIASVSLTRKNQTLKSVLYSIGSLVNANKYICLDVDMLVLDDIRRVFDALDAHPPDTILIARDAFMKGGSLSHQLCTHYRGQTSDIALLLGRASGESDNNFIVNDGFFAGTRRALLGIESVIRNMTHAVGWMDYYPDHNWRNQFIFNLALAYLRCPVELDTRYNLQIHMHDVDFRLLAGRPQAIWHGRPVHVVHFVAGDATNIRNGAAVLHRENFDEAHHDRRSCLFRTRSLAYHAGEYPGKHIALRQGCAAARWAGRAYEECPTGSAPSAPLGHFRAAWRGRLFQPLGPRRLGGCLRPAGERLAGRTRVARLSVSRPRGGSAQWAGRPVDEPCLERAGRFSACRRQAGHDFLYCPASCSSLRFDLAPPRTPVQPGRFLLRCPPGGRRRHRRGGRRLWAGPVLGDGLQHPGCPVRLAWGLGLRGLCLSLSIQQKAGTSRASLF